MTERTVSSSRDSCLTYEIIKHREENWGLYVGEYMMTLTEILVIPVLVSTLYKLQVSVNFTPNITNASNSFFTYSSPFYILIPRLIRIYKRTVTLMIFRNYKVQSLSVGGVLKTPRFTTTCIVYYLCSYWHTENK